MGTVKRAPNSGLFALQKHKLMKTYTTLFKQYKDQDLNSVFAHFYPINNDYEAPFKALAAQTSDGEAAWEFQQARFKEKYSKVAVPKLRNYLNYTFIRLCFLEQSAPDQYFYYSKNRDFVAFNSGLQDTFGGDLLLVFQKYKPNAASGLQARPDWVYKWCITPTEERYRSNNF